MTNVHVVIAEFRWLQLTEPRVASAGPVELTAGDVVLLPGGAAHVLADSRGTDPVDLVAPPDTGEAAELPESCSLGRGRPWRRRPCSGLR